MAEQTTGKTIFTLYEVARSIQKVISGRYQRSYWIKAEMNKLNYYVHSGYAYPELVEKRNGLVVAEMRSIIWRDDFQRINNLFLKILKEPLKDGISILFSAKISYDPKYGLSLNIIDIDPSYSLGELEKEKQDSITFLKNKGIYGSNKLAPLALLPKRLAIISVGTSKGYADFLNILDRNINGYTFFHLLFPAILQGEKAVESILNQLTRIRRVMHHFDAVAIIRGGGGDVGLSCYNDVNLATSIALFPIPVFTGIGHSTNETVTELVSHTNAITPTALAALLIARFEEFATPLKKAEQTIVQRSRQLIKEDNLALKNLVKYFRSAGKSKLSQMSNDMKHISSVLYQQSISLVTLQNLQQQHFRNSLFSALNYLIPGKKSALMQLVSGLQKDVTTGLQNAASGLIQIQKDFSGTIGQVVLKGNTEVLRMEDKINLMNPVNVLKRGFTITKLDGKVITNSAKISAGDVITTILINGVIESKVTATNDPTG